MGEATFGSELGPATPVRPVTLKEVIATGRKIRGLDGKEFSALLALREALEACDELALAKAKERLQEVYRLKERDHVSRQLPQNEESRKKFAELMASSIGLPAEESFKHYEGLRPGPRAMKNPSLLLSQEVSRIVVVVPFEIHRAKHVSCEAVNLIHAKAQTPHREENAVRTGRVRTVWFRV
ncbi:MAG TPA: hypothetical protein VHX63_11300 [Acidobacteriaceae bacterium]|jgi:hypothetical protein|nr:hypothetical protein [Acidobacteriaceae bacterium]